MPKWTGFAAREGGSDFADKKKLPHLADNHETELSDDGIIEGCRQVLADIDAQTGDNAKSWTEQFKDSPFYISPKK